MEGECETTVRRRESWGIPVINREIIYLLRASVKLADVTSSGDMHEVHKENTQTLKSCPGKEGRVAVGGSGPWELRNGISDLGCLHWKCEPREWISTRSLTQKCQQDQLLAVSCFKKRSEAVLRPTEAPDYAEEQKARILVGGVADGHNADARLVASCSSVVHLERQMGEHTKRLEACMEKRKNELSVVASDFGEKSIVLEDVSQEIRETEMTLCRILTGDKNIQRQWKEMIPQKSTTHGDKVQVGTRAITEPVYVICEGQECVLSNPLELGTKISYMPETEGQKEEQRNYLNGTWQVCKVSRHAASDEALGQHELCRSSRASCPTEPLGLMEALVQLQYQPFSQEQLMNDIDKGVQATPNLEQAARCCCEDRCSILGGHERERRDRTTQGSVVLAQVGAQNGSVKSRLKANTSDPQARDTEPTGLLSDLSMDSEDKEDACIQETWDLDAQLWRGRGELHACEKERWIQNRCQLLEEEGQEWRPTGSIPAQRSRARGAALSEQSQNSQQSLVPDKELASAKEKKTQRSQQQERPALQSSVKHLQEDLELAWRERGISPPEELDTQVTPDLQVLFQRVKVLEHSLGDNVSIFMASEEALKNRIEELEASERKLLVRVKDLMEQAAGQSAAVSWQRQEERLHTLREDMQSMRMEKERSERLWKERLRRCQEQLRTKEEEMKMQGDYFEHFKLKQQQKLSLAREREHALQRRVYELEREAVDLMTTATLLRAELVRQPCGEPPEQEGWEEERDKLNMFISSLQQDLRELLGHEEVGQEERQALLERLQAAEDNGEFLSHRLEDLRSRVQQLRLSEGRLLDELEELAKENVQLHRGHQTLPGAESGLQEAVPEDGNKQAADMAAIEKQLQLKREAALDPARSKGAQTPSMTQCIQEAIMVSKLIPALSRSQSCSYEGVLEISFLPLLETNSLGLAEIMQTLRCGGEEQAQQNMEQLELRKVLVSQPGVVNHTQNEEGALSSQKGVMAVQSLPDLLKLFGNKFQNSNLISLVSKTIDVDCNSMDNDLPATGLSCRSYTCDRCKLTNEEIKLLNEDVLRLQAEIGSLRDNKNELESVVRSKEEAMRRLLEEIVQLKRIGAESCSSGVSYQDPVLLSCEKDELHLETLKHNWRQENKALFRRNEELLGQLARLEGDHEQELVRLRLQVTMLEKEVVRLEEENKEHCCAVEEDQKVIKELQDTLWIRNEEVGTLCQKQKEDMALIAELWETQGAKTEQSMLLEDVTSHISYDASAGNLKEPQVEESKEMQKEQQKAFRMSSDAQTLRNEGSQEVTSPRSDNSTLSIIMSTSVEGKNLKEEGPPDTGMTIDGIQQHPVLKDHLGANNVVKRSVQKARVVFRFSREPQKLQECTPAREVDVSPQNIKVTQKSHTTHYSYKTVNLGRTLQERPNVTGELNNVRKELAATVADLQQSQEYLDRAKTEAQKWYRELGLAESRREEAEKKASQALNELKRMKRCLKESEGMKKEHNELKDEVEELRRQMVHLEKEHINAVSVRTRLEEKLVSLLTCLDVKCGTEDELRAKNLALEGCESALESWCDTVKKLKAHYDDIKYQFEELRKLKTQCDLDTAPLKAKLACVVQKCRERNSLIVQLVRARRRCGCIHRSLMQEAEDLVNDTALLEYSSAFGPAAAAVQLTQDNLRESLEAGRPDNAEGPWFNSHGSLMEKHTPLSYRLCVAKTDYCPSPDMPQTALPILPLSAGEEVQVAGVPDGRGLCHAEVKGEAGLVPARFLEEKDASEQSPASGSETAGPLPKLTGPEKILEVHHQLQQLHRSNYQILPLAECSSTPELGHFSASAQFQSQHALRGLSKASGVSRSTPPFHKKGEMRRGEQQEPQQETKSVFAEPVGTAAKDTTVILNISPPRADVCRAAAKDHLPNRANMAASPDAPSPEDRPIRAKLDPPAPVVSLKVMKTVGQSGLMIGWERPPLDELGCSNGTFVCGYRVYVDGEFHKYVMSSACTKAVLENLDLSVPVHISVQTLGSNGLLAEKVHILFEGSWPPAGPASTLGAPVRRWHSWTSQLVTTRAPTMEQTTLKSTTEPALCVAIYNYSPLKDSPNIHPSRELAFREGDTVWVLGEPRQDGFCEAEVNGTRGLAPVAFLEEIKSRLPSEE